MDQKTKKTRIMTQKEAQDVKELLERRQQLFLERLETVLATKKQRRQP